MATPEAEAGARPNSRAMPRLLTCRVNSKKVPRVELVQKLSIEAARLDRQMVKLTLLITLDQDVLLNRLLTD